MQPSIIKILTLATLAVAVSASTPAPDGFRWPVDLEPGVSSSFCDYRDGRFHAGIDVRTFGQEGIACRAVRDGFVSRVRASSRGYGKALHVTLDTGVQVVYAHLSEFVPELEDTLWVEQERAGRYSVDVPLPAGRYPVRRGDIIAYSGSTGATAPHLHFEVRTLDDEPLNPLRHGFALSDAYAPTVPRIVFVPLSVNATVEGRTYPLEIEPRRLGPGRYAIADTLQFSGDVGVAASVVDKLNGRSGRLTPHEMQVWSDGTELARVTFERFRFDEVKHVDQAMDMGALRGRGTDIYSLYQRAGDPREHVEFVRGGRIAPAPTTRRIHEGRVVALDAAGNRAEVAFLYMDSVAVQPLAHGEWHAPDGARWRESHVAVDLGGAYFQNDFAVVLMRDTPHRLTERGHAQTRIDTTLLRAPELAGQTRVFGESRPVGAAPDRSVEFSSIRASEGGTIVWAGGVALTFPADAVYGDAVLFAVGEGDARADRQRSLKSRSQAVQLGPVGLVVKQSARLRIPFDAPSAQDGVFRSGTNGGPWSYVPTTVDSAGLSAAFDRPGVFAVFRDASAPWIGQARVVTATSYATGAKTYEVHVPVDDEGSGFDDSRTEIFVGGTRRIWRWDFVAKKIIVALRNEPIIGPQPVRVVAFDRIGNSSSADYSLTFEARASN